MLSLIKYSQPGILVFIHVHVFIIMFYRAVIKMRNVAAFCEKEHAVSSMDPCTVYSGWKKVVCN